MPFAHSHTNRDPEGDYEDDGGEERNRSIEEARSSALVAARYWLGGRQPAENTALMDRMSDEAYERIRYVAPAGLA